MWSKLFKSSQPGLESVWADLIQHWIEFLVMTVSWSGFSKLYFNEQYIHSTVNWAWNLVRIWFWGRMFL